jgi:hypothetical protein
LISLASGYMVILDFVLRNKSIKMDLLLNISQIYLDVRIQEYFKSKAHTVHELARFILRDLIGRPGLLIEEIRLAARLGIDVENSSDWAKLLNLLEEYKYTGPFNQAWPRWWAYGIEKEWWPQISDQN